MSIPSPLHSLGTVLLVSLLTSACESESTGPGGPPVEGEITIDATNPTGFTYFTFTDGGSLVTVSNPATSTEWDMAFRRFTVKLNGGVAGPGGVGGANLENNAELDSAAVLALTPADGEADFAAVTDADASGVIFVEDDIVADPAAWLVFGSMGPVANPTAAWKVRLGNGDYAVVRAVQLGLGPSITATLEVRHQAAGGTLSAIDSVEVDVTMGPAFVNVELAATVAPAGCNWDLQVAPLSGDLDLTVNTDCSAGTFPLDAGEDFSAIAAADDAPEYGPFLSVVSGAFPTSFDGPEGVFWYNIDGSMRLFPTYNVFLVEVGSAIYKVQITDYYNATGESGYPTMRYEQLR